MLSQHENHIVTPEDNAPQASFYSSQYTAQDRQKAHLLEEPEHLLDISGPSDDPSDDPYFELGQIFGDGVDDQQIDLGLDFDVESGAIVSTFNQHEGFNE